MSRCLKGLPEDGFMTKEFFGNVCGYCEFVGECVFRKLLEKKFLGGSV
jgi:hypothetical protein